MKAAGIRVFSHLLLPLLVSLSPLAVMADEMAVRLQALMTAGQRGELPGVDIEQWPELQRLYANQNGRLIWSDHRGSPRMERRQQLAAWLGRAYTQGLDPAAYGGQRMRLVSVKGSPIPVFSSEILLNDLLMSAAFMRLASDLSGSGIDLALIDPLWRLPAKSLDSVALLSRLEQGSSVDQLLGDLLPRSAEYERLVALHAKLAQQTRRPYQSLRLPNAVLHPGDRHVDVTVLREGLVRLGLLAPEVDRADELYTPQVADAVRRYQQREGLEVDGIYGPETRALMLLSPVERRQRVRANLARWRALPSALGERYLLVRTASYSLDLVEQGQVVARHAVISGRPQRPSPSFVAEMNSLTVNPYWNVPFRLAVEDLLPKQQRDARYFERQGIEVLARQQGQWVPVDSTTVDWTAVSRRNFHYLLRQRPGPQNSLGKIRFGMANPYSIFLHDTPQQSLFARRSRDISSGCIRVREIDRLAQTLLDDTPLSAALTTDRPRDLMLPRPLPVYLVYLSVWVDEDRQAYYYPDAYGLDARMVEFLGPLPVPLGENRDGP
ncbi:L,D-transpeptidase family protein [Marinobacterium marinum]|uniref:L,D-transpeptidase family protein n=1 Tax=Marinobacterium marinum TaxID=2756129 RepID=A0A7W1X041_9GAMM|nr:L,D-transpeptidase family protein [Marinobacterium marinum]MBA4503425.1 L,D-transpeptidase family protein [Marinobacterium marinum]